MRPSRQAIHALADAALGEDAPWGDITSQTLLPATVEITAKLVAREPGILSGQDIFAESMSVSDPAIETEFHFQDGAPFTDAAVLATVRGPARGILQAERVALNFVQHLCAIATETSKYVGQVRGTKARIVDTRKTTPGLRLLERYAVRCGGGLNHRYSLSDAVMVKDNHLAVLQNAGAPSISDALRTLRASLPHTTHIEVEVDRIDQLEAVLAAGVDCVLLDNFTPEQLREGVKLVAGRALIEASGGVSLATVRDIASTGVDIISVGALTHSVRALDLGLDMEPSAPSPESGLR